MRIRLDAARCTGHGRCYTLAPEVFDPDDQGHCHVTHELPEEELQERARAAVGSCPERALEIVD